MHDAPLPKYTLPEEFLEKAHSLWSSGVECYALINYRTNQIFWGDVGTLHGCTSPYEQVEEADPDVDPSDLIGFHIHPAKLGACGVTFSTEDLASQLSRKIPNALVLTSTGDLKQMTVPKRTREIFGGFQARDTEFSIYSHINPIIRRRMKLKPPPVAPAIFPIPKHRYEEYCQHFSELLIPYLKKRYKIRVFDRKSSRITIH